MSDNIDKEFETLTDKIGPLRVGPIMGPNEVAARDQMGDAEYEKMSNLVDNNNLAQVQNSFARVGYVNSMAYFQRSLGLFVRIAGLLAIGWSIFYWVH